ncbi:hypothetical protein B0G83_1024 [Paraburkholderia sp. BL21I4N1]|nr:hypothetical protein B0G83_1024 [Paraburkholderia sp. BL21I4N1]
MNQQSMLPVTETLQKQKHRREEQTLAEFLVDCKATGNVAIDVDDPIYTYTERAGIPNDFLEIAWLEFRERHLDNTSKRYRDWRAAFRNSVRDRWFRLWYFDNDECLLTVQGQQAARVHGKATPNRNASENAKAKQMLFGSSPRRPSRHSGFDQINYREGVNEDGSF